MAYRGQPDPRATRAFDYVPNGRGARRFAWILLLFAFSAAIILTRVAITATECTRGSGGVRCEVRRGPALGRRALVERWSMDGARMVRRDGATLTLVTDRPPHEQAPHVALNLVTVRLADAEMAAGVERFLADDDRATWSSSSGWDRAAVGGGTAVSMLLVVLIVRRPRRVRVVIDRVDDKFHVLRGATAGGPLHLDLADVRDVEVHPGPRAGTHRVAVVLASGLRIALFPACFPGEHHRRLADAVRAALAELPERRQG